MKYIFVADDRESKRDNIIDTLREIFPEAVIVPSDCLNELFQSLQVTFADKVREHPSECLVVTDMMMPTLHGSSINPECGYRVLLRLKSCEFACPAIVVSSESIDEARAESLYDHYVGFVHYHSWSDQELVYRKVLKDYIK